jgi:hypothetical protein
MMGRILGKNAQIFTFHELHFFEQLWSPSEMKNRIQTKDARDLFAKLICIEREGYLSGCTNYTKYLPEAEQNITMAMPKSNVFAKFLQYETNRNKKHIPCDQTPRNLFYTQEIIELFPDAKIIYMIRDPRDVLLSQKNKWKRRFLGAKTIPLKEAFRAWVNYHPITISKLWKASVHSMKPLEDNDSVKKIYFETLLKSPSETIQDICKFIGIEYSDEMLNVPQIGSSTGNDTPESKGINKNKTAGYKNGGLSNVELHICESHLKDSMLSHGYIPEGFKANTLGVVYYYITFPIKIIIALALNLNRMKNIVETIKRRMS